MPLAIDSQEFMSFFRRYSDHLTVDGSKLRFMTEVALSSDKETESTTTMDGTVNTVTDGANTAEFSSLAYREDTGVIALWKELKKMFDNNELVEFWNVDTGSGVGGVDLEVTYHRGYFTSFSISYSAGSKVTLSYTYTIDGKGVEGTDTLTPEQLEAVNSTQYDYTTIKAVGKGV